MKLNLLICLILSFPIFSQSEIAIYFEFDSFEIDAQNALKIEQLSSSTNSQNITIVGYTDQKGSSSYNEKLSQKRANAVKQALILSGTDTSKIISTSGKGKFPNLNLAHHEQRTVIITFEKKIEETPKPIESILSKQISSLEIGGKLAIPNLEFVPGSHFPLESSLPTLYQLLEIMKSNSLLKIELQGHICCKAPNTGDGLNNDTGYNTLSVDRARYVYEFLIHYGIDANRLSYKGFAANRPLSYLEDPSSQQANRRVEIMIISK